MTLLHAFRSLMKPPAPEASPINALLAGAKPLFPEYVSAHRGHAVRTTYLMGAVVGMAKTYEDTAEAAFIAELAKLEKHLHEDPCGVAKAFAKWVLEADDDDPQDALNRCVSGETLRARMQRLSMVLS